MTSNQVTYKLGGQVIKLLINPRPLYTDRYCLGRSSVAERLSSVSYERKSRVLLNIDTVTFPPETRDISARFLSNPNRICGKVLGSSSSRCW